MISQVSMERITNEINWNWLSVRFQLYNTPFYLIHLHFSFRLAKITCTSVDILEPFLGRCRIVYLISVFPVSQHFCSVKWFRPKKFLIAFVILQYALQMKDYLGNKKPIGSTLSLALQYRFPPWISKSYARRVRANILQGKLKINTKRIEDKEITFAFHLRTRTKISMETQPKMENMRLFLNLILLILSKKICELNIQFVSF